MKGDNTSLAKSMIDPAGSSVGGYLSNRSCVHVGRIEHSSKMVYQGYKVLEQEHSYNKNCAK